MGNSNTVISKLPDGIRILHLPTSVSIFRDKDFPEKQLIEDLMEEIAGCNVTKETIFVNHADLRRFSPDSKFKSYCPACKEGILAVSRDNESLELLAIDRCLLCGQQVVYADIEDLRKGL